MFVPLLPTFLFDFVEALTLIIVIIDFIMVYIIFRDTLNSQLIAAIMSAIITYLLIIPYGWMAWLIFLSTFAYSFFWGFKPWTWAKEGERNLEEEQGP